MKSEASSANDLIHASNIVIVGISGSGKSTVGKHLSVLLGMGFLDLDLLIESISGKSIPSLFESGENVFREWETKALESIVRIRSHVVALGAGALQDERSISIAKKIGPLVWLKPPADEIARRLFMKVQELEKRPLLKDLINIDNHENRKQMIRERIEQMTDKRSAMYQASDYVLNGGYVTPETSACQLKEILTADGFPDLKGNRFAIWHGQEW